jgi:hypothetical protein
VSNYRVTITVERVYDHKFPDRISREIPSVILETQPADRVADFVCDELVLMRNELDRMAKEKV